MIFQRTNIEEKLSRVRLKQHPEKNWKFEIQQILENQEQKIEEIATKVTESSGGKENNFNIDILDADKIYHIDQIKKICIDYRLRFLDTKFFKGKIPRQAYAKIQELENKHNTELKGFKIIAPSKLFKLENADDPLLFAPIGNDYYYLIHKWGRDLHPLRKTMMWFFKSFENLIVLTALVSLLLTFLVPDGLFSKENNLSTFMMVFFFMFKSVAAVVIFYGFALGKNFNTQIWNSKYFNA